MRKVLVYTAITLAMVFWSLSFIWYKQAFDIYNIKPVTLILLRLILSSVMLFWFCFFTKKLVLHRVKDLWMFALLALFQPFLYYYGEATGMDMVSPSLGSIIISTIPLFTPFAAYMVFKESLTRWNFVGVIISFAGVVLMIVEGGMPETSSINGILLLFLAVFAAIIYTMLLKNITNNYGPITILTYQNALGIIYFLPLFLFNEVQYFQPDSFDINAYVLLFNLSFFATTLAFIFFIFSVKELGAARTSVFTNIIPVFTAVFSYFILDEYLSLNKIGAISIVIIGLMLVQRKKKLNGSKA